MPRARAAWWVTAIAASILGYLTLITYADVFGPGAVGVGLRFRDGRAVVIETVPGYPAAKAGLAPGDRILSADGTPVPTLFEWWLAASNFEVARPARFEFDRGGQRRETTVSFDPHWRRFGAGTWFALAVRLTAQLVTLGLAVVIAVRRPRDLVALVAAAWLAAVSVTDLAPIAAADPHTPAPPNGALAIWRALPWWITPPLWLGFTAFAFGPVLVMVFYGLFPRPMFSRRRAWILWVLSWTPLVLGVPTLLTQVARGLYEPGHGIGKVPPSTTPSIGLGVAAALVVTVSLLVTRYRRFADLAERRRLRVVLVGTLVGLAVPATVAMSGFADLPAAVRAVLRSPVTRVLASISYLVLPVSLAYGILRHRLLDVGTILRRGLQYALARRVALSIVPACAVLLAIDLVVHGDQPLLAVLRSRGWAYAAVAVLAGLVHSRRQKWFETLDRRFFRERYDAQRLLSEVVEEIRRATNLEGVASRVVSRIESALHPEYVVLLSRQPRDAAYRFIASAPARPPDFVLRSDSKIVGLVRLLGRPVDTSAADSGWLKEQLPHDETTFLRDSRIGLVVPVALGTDTGRESLLVLGIKRSEEPYSREDQDLLQAVAGSLALLAERPATASRRSDFAPGDVDAGLTLPAESFAECVRCGACQDRRASSCEYDGGQLEEVRLPRELAGRYRLIRRLGRGGMGSVYEAADLSLERRVAVKVIREDLVGSVEAAERFRREARASASVAHPNVVTVYDFGIAAGMRAFLVMELLRGGTLRDRLRQHGRLEPAGALAILRPICDAVEAAHRRQLVHRDLKPENVFLADEGKAGALPHGHTVKVLDFGIARFLSADQSRTTTVVTDRPIGTLHYMGPEQLRGGQPDRSWDIWALAVMAYEMLAGVLPFPSATAVDYQVAVLAARPLPISLELGAAAGGLDPFFSRALSADPAERPSSPLSLADTLAGALARAAHDAR